MQTQSLSRFLLVRVPTKIRQHEGRQFSVYGEPEILLVLDHGGGRKMIRWRIPGGTDRRGECAYMREFEEETGLPFPTKARIFEGVFEATRLGVGLVPTERYQHQPRGSFDREIVMARWFRLSQIPVTGREKSSRGARCHRGDMILLARALTPHLSELAIMFGQRVISDFFRKII